MSGHKRFQNFALILNTKQQYSSTLIQKFIRPSEINIEINYYLEMFNFNDLSYEFNEEAYELPQYPC